jgi:hypothetical protein
MQPDLSQPNERYQIFRWERDVEELDQRTEESIEDQLRQDQRSGSGNDEAAP